MIILSPKSKYPYLKDSLIFFMLQSFLFLIIYLHLQPLKTSVKLSECIKNFLIFSVSIFANSSLGLNKFPESCLLMNFNTIHTRDVGLYLGKVITLWQSAGKA